MKFVIDEALNFDNKDEASKTIAATVLSMYMTSPVMMTIIATIIISIFVYQLVDQVFDFIKNIDE
jgi:hypothetical protein